MRQPGPRGRLVQLAHLDDTANRLLHRRPAAAKIKEAVCKGTVSFRREARKPGYFWLKGGKRPSSRLSRRRWSRRVTTGDGRPTSRRTRRTVHAAAAAAVHDRLRDPRSATESDDVLQDSYLRWAEVDLATVQDTKSYLAQLVTRQALNALRASTRRREDYIGPWLPEPLLLETGDASSDVVLAESVSMAMLVVLETLRPDERAVFVLREVFGFGHDEIASTIGKSVGGGASDGAPRPRTCACPAQAVRARRPQALAEQITARSSPRRDRRHRRTDWRCWRRDVVWTADSDGKATAAAGPSSGASRWPS